MNGEDSNEVVTLLREQNVLLRDQATKREAEAAKREEELLKLIEKFSSAGYSESGGKVNVSSSDYQDVANQITPFIYAPEDYLTFDRWIERVNQIFASDKGQNVSDKDKIAIICAKLSSNDYDQLANDTLPKKVQELSMTEIIASLKKLFGRKDSLFTRRRKAWEIKIASDESYLALASRIKRAAEDFEFNTFKSDDLMVQLFVQALDSPQHSAQHTAIRKKMMERADEHHVKMENADDPKTIPVLTLDSLAATAQRMADLEKANTSSESFTGHREVLAVQNGSGQPVRRLPKCKGFHFHVNCPFKDKQCSECHQKGHKQGFCAKAKAFENKAWRRPPTVAKTNVDEVVTSKSGRKFVRPFINGTRVHLKHDSGSDWTLISERNWQRIGSPKLTPSAMEAVSATGNAVSNKGYFSAVIELKGIVGVTDVYVSNNGLNLFGNNTMEALDLWKLPITAVCDSISEVHATISNEVSIMFPKLFSKALGKCNRTKFSLLFTKEAKVPFVRARPVPFGARDSIEKELERLEREGIISRINYADSAAPIVVVKKKNGKIRIAADYSTGLNRALEFYHYPLPTPQTIFATLSDCDTFSHIDLSSAFLQVELDSEAKKYMNINTHVGLFQMNRMQPGVKTAPGQFQQLMDSILAGTGAMA
jgi:hypothetical protein